MNSGVRVCPTAWINVAKLVATRAAPNLNRPQNRILSSISRPHLSPNLGKVDELGRTHDSPFSGLGEIS
jgi:hypothetical protein